MDHRALQQFLNLAETLHFGRAAEAAHVSPSALSRSIRRLEQEAGAELFERDNRRVSLTPAGRLFLDYARSALGDWDAVRNALMARGAELQGELDKPSGTDLRVASYNAYQHNTHLNERHHHQC